MFLKLEHARRSEEVGGLVHFVLCGLVRKLGRLERHVRKRLGSLARRGCQVFCLVGWLVGCLVGWMDGWLMVSW